MAGLTIDNPVRLAEALASTRVIPGDTLVLLPGTYTASQAGAVGGTNAAGKGVFRVQVKGTSAAPITIKPLTPGTVRINGGLELIAPNAGYVIVKDLEIAPTPTDREMAREAVDWPDAIYCTAPGCEFYGNYVHDGRQGFSVFGTGGCKIIGNIIINNGWMEDEGHGTGIYTHNNSGGTITLSRNVWNSLGEHSVNMWSASTNKVIDYLMSKNVVLDSGLFAGCEEGICEDNTIDDNHCYRSFLRLGRPSPYNGLIYARRNRVYAQYVPFAPFWQRGAVVNDNHFINDLEVLITYIPATENEANTINNNKYFGVIAAGVYSYSHERVITWAEWATLGYDADSAFTAGLPTANEVFVYPLEGSDRWIALVVVWNWEGLDSVSVDVGEVLSPEDGYKAINAQDMANDVQTGEVDEDGLITIDMRAISHTVAAPIEWTAPATTFPTFGAFVIEEA